MKKTISLKPAYGTTNTVRFEEEGTSEARTFLGATSKAAGQLGTPYNLYLDEEQLAALNWVPTHVGEPYQTEPTRQGKTYTRVPVEGPGLKLTIEVA